ncbi:hypothetical protein SETIT_4G269900v2 [Setaria italica]|uniref:Plastocyanin-like domain-containing protein n=1 Tax=Setaria italica TaxID=4555 RepID=A0A368R0K8_SETIT|nr:hypothetical protein SETIT_4G269900v2 [Setaria italica]
MSTFSSHLGTVCRHGRQFCTRMASPEDKVLSTMNNISFQLPMVETSLLEKHYYNSSDMYTFQVLPDRPPMAFNYTDETLIPLGPKEAQLEPTSQATVVRRFRYGTTVEVVFQNTALMSSDSNPMHLHGHNMFVLAQGIGTYNATRDVERYNLVDPPVRNTVQVPRLGWAAIRFVTDNPERDRDRRHITAMAAGDGKELESNNQKLNPGEDDLNVGSRYSIWSAASAELAYTCTTAAGTCFAGLHSAMSSLQIRRGRASNWHQGLLLVVH